MLDKKKFYINGEWVDPKNPNNFEVINPSTEEVCAVINLGSSDDTNSAVKAARNAFETWKETSKEERLLLLEKLLKIYKARWDDMTDAITTELGCPKDWCSANQTSSGAGHIEDFIKRLKDFNFEPGFDNGSVNHIVYEPIGVCGLITPWNWPINQIALKVIPAFATKNAADTIKRVCLELGGKGGNIVFADSYPDAVRDGIRNVMSNSGQSCDAPTRMLVEKSIYKRAVEEAADEANKIKVDLASKAGEHIGPVISKTQFDKIKSLIKSGIDEGATLVAGGPDKPENFKKGYFIKPTVFTDVNNDMRIAKEEIFGPVLSIIPFENEEEAIKITNDTEYGLGNYLQTEDKEKAKRVSKKLRSGIVYVNHKPADSGTPFGGYRQSGNGREGGTWGLHEYLEVKTITEWKN